MDWKNRLQLVQEKLREQLYARKVDGLHNLIKLFHEYDLNQNGLLDRYEFDRFINKSGMFISTQETSELFRHYDLNRDEQLNMEEFLKGIQGQMSQSRLEIVKFSWKELAVENNKIQIQALLDNFNTSKHPRVVTREKTPEMVREELIKSLEAITDGSGVVTEDDWLLYCNSLSATIPKKNDEYFAILMTEPWGLTSKLPNDKIQQLENVLYEKVRQRTNTKEDEGKALYRIMKFYDKSNKGRVLLPEFREGLISLGCTFSAQESKSLFDYYDQDQSGALLYGELCAAFSHRSDPSGKSQVPLNQVPIQTLEKVKKVLLKRGNHGIRGLGIIFRRMDDSRDLFLDRYEFEWALVENGHKLSPAELERLFKYFDRNADGKVSYSEFLKCLRGELNQRRQAIVNLAFQKLDANGERKITLENLKFSYDPTQHPKYKTGEMSAEQIFKDFIAQWDQVQQDGTISYEEFVEYYKDVSASFDRDDEFEQSIRSSWHLTGEVIENTEPVAENKALNQTTKSVRFQATTQSF